MINCIRDLIPDCLAIYPICLCPPLLSSPHMVGYAAIGKKIMRIGKYHISNTPEGYLRDIFSIKETPASSL